MDFYWGTYLHTWYDYGLPYPYEDNLKNVYEVVRIAKEAGFTGFILHESAYTSWDADTQTFIPTNLTPIIKDGASTIPASSDNTICRILYDNGFDIILRLWAYPGNVDYGDPTLKFYQLGLNYYSRNAVDFMAQFCSDINNYKDDYGLSVVDYSSHIALGADFSGELDDLSVGAGYPKPYISSLQHYLNVTRTPVSEQDLINRVTMAPERTLKEVAYVKNQDASIPYVKSPGFLIQTLLKVAYNNLDLTTQTFGPLIGSYWYAAVDWRYSFPPFPSYCNFSCVNDANQPTTEVSQNYGLQTSRDAVKFSCDMQRALNADYRIIEFDLEITDGVYNLSTGSAQYHSGYYVYEYGDLTEGEKGDLYSDVVGRLGAGGAFFADTYDSLARKINWADWGADVSIETYDEVYHCRTTALVESIVGKNDLGQYSSDYDIQDARIIIPKVNSDNIVGISARSNWQHTGDYAVAHYVPTSTGAHLQIVEIPFSVSTSGPFPYTVATTFVTGPFAPTLSAYLETTGSNMAFGIKSGLTSGYISAPLTKINKKSSSGKFGISTVYVGTASETQFESQAIQDEIMERCGYITDRDVNINFTHFSARYARYWIPYLKELSAQITGATANSVKGIVSHYGYDIRDAVSDWYAAGAGLDFPLKVYWVK